jgi:Flp pilus assembly protein TadG
MRATRQHAEHVSLLAGVRHRLRGRTRGQATVEFALSSIVFLMLVFGTVDFGRVAFTYSQLHNAVREGARVGKVTCGKSGWTGDVKQRVVDMAGGTGLTAGNVNVTSTTCDPPTGQVEVRAQTTFTAVTQDLLGISPITLRARAVVDVE